MKKSGLKNIAVIAAVGLISGVVNGFLGTGGGIIIILTLGLMRSNAEKKKKSPFTGSSKQDCFIALASILPMSAVSLFSYQKNGTLNFSRSLSFVIPAVAGGLLGAFLLERISPVWLKRIFAVLMAVSGVIMVSRSF
ncbi:MAG: sulfite exporter TauE/SafE family protein [Clostridia bacterium]|nr:sulfite exporter TauE/SafE family protein [Clostridia bacterium]